MFVKGRKQLKSELKNSRAEVAQLRSGVAGVAAAAIVDTVNDWINTGEDPANGVSTGSLDVIHTTAETLALEAAARQALSEIPPELVVRFVAENYPDLVNPYIGRLTPEELASTIYKTEPLGLLDAWADQGGDAEALFDSIRNRVNSPNAYEVAVKMYEEIGYIDINRLPEGTFLNLYTLYIGDNKQDQSFEHVADPGEAVCPTGYGKFDGIVEAVTTKDRLGQMKLITRDVHARSEPSFRGWPRELVSFYDMGLHEPTHALTFGGRQIGIATTTPSGSIHSTLRLGELVQMTVRDQYAPRA